PLHDRSSDLDLLAGLFAMLSLQVAFRFTASYTVELYPLTYLLVAYLATVNRRQVGLVLIVAAAGIELASWIAGHPAGIAAGPAAPRVFMRVGFILTFAFLYAAFHRVAVLRSGRVTRRELIADSRRIELRGRELGLSGSRSMELMLDDVDRQTHRERLIAHAITGCERASYHNLRVLKHGLRARTAVLLWLDDDRPQLRGRELVSDSNLVMEHAFPAGSGAIGGITRNQEPINLRGLRPGYRGISYYRSGERVGAFLGVPVLEHGHLRGVLCVDRDTDEPFTHAD